MRFIHTADWHLGHKLHGQSRHEEHKIFLDWLIEQSVTHDIDALLIAGDVFDTPNPPAEALKLLYKFFHKLHQRAPHVKVIVIGGNHDSAQRLEAPQLLLHEFNVHVIGGMPPQSALDFERLFVPLYNRAGERRAWVLAVPYLRPSDLPNVTPRPDNYLIEGVREVYRVALEELTSKREEGEGVIVMGHCYMASSKLSEDSERKILGNHQNALPIDLFPMDVSYVALGHLHLAQALNGVEKIRYSGSPIPLSLSERHYKHQVALIELSDELEESPPTGEAPVKRVSFKSFTPLYTPRGVEMIRIPDTHGGGVSVEEALEALRALPLKDEQVPNWQRPFLHVSVTLEQAMPHLKALVFEALKDKHPRLSRLQVIRVHQGSDASISMPAHHLSELTPERVFALRWQREHPNTALPDDLLDAFHTLINEVQETEGSKP